MSRFGISSLSVMLACAIVSACTFALWRLAIYALPVHEWLNEHTSIVAYIYAATIVLYGVAVAAVSYWIKGLLTWRHRSPEPPAPV